MRAVEWKEQYAAATCEKREVYELLRRVRQITRTWSRLHTNTSFMGLNYTEYSTFRAGRGSVVGVATRYVLDAPGIESR
jgi:hypothetical protein